MKTSARPVVSVVVLNCNGAHVLDECLRSLAAQDYPHLEVIVVDNASVDRSQEVVRRHRVVRWVGLPRNDGLGPGYNAGAQGARGQKIFFVNNDVRFEPDCVRRLVEAFRSADILAADPLQLEWSGRCVIHGAQRFRLGWRFVRFGVTFLDPYQDVQIRTETEVPWGCAGALMFDRQKFDALGGFDPSFFLDYEDVDICWRGWLRGWKTVFVPQARVYHRVGESHAFRTGADSSAGAQPTVLTPDRRMFSQMKNAQRFILKTMDVRVISLTLLVELGRVLAGIARGRPRSSYLRVRAACANLRDAREILRERRRTLAGAIVSSAELKQQFTRLRS